MQTGLQVREPVVEGMALCGCTRSSEVKWFPQIPSPAACLTPRQTLHASLHQQTHQTAVRFCDAVADHTAVIPTDLPPRPQHADSNTAPPHSVTEVA